MVSSTARAAAQATGLPPNVEPWSPLRARCPLAEADAGADRQAAAEALGEREDVGEDALGLVGEPRAGAADAALDLVEHQQRARRVAGLPGGAQVAVRGGTTPPSPSVGSRKTAATSASTALASAAASP